MFGNATSVALGLAGIGRQWNDTTTSSCVAKGMVVNHDAVYSQMNSLGQRL